MLHNCTQIVFRYHSSNCRSCLLKVMWPWTHLIWGQSTMHRLMLIAVNQQTKTLLALRVLKIGWTPKFKKYITSLRVFIVYMMVLLSSCTLNLKTSFTHSKNTKHINLQRSLAVRTYTTSCAHTHTHNCFTAVLDSVRDYPGEPAPQVKPIWIYWSKR